MNWLSRLFGVQPPSAQVAKDRLKVVLSYDRTNITPELIERLKDDIVDAISSHIEIDRAGIEITTEHGEKGEHLIADIPIRATRNPVITKGVANQVATVPEAVTLSASRKRETSPTRKKKRRS